MQVILIEDDGHLRGLLKKADGSRLWEFRSEKWVQNENIVAAVKPTTIYFYSPWWKRTHWSAEPFEGDQSLRLILSDNPPRFEIVFEGRSCLFQRMAIQRQKVLEKCSPNLWKEPHMQHEKIAISLAWDEIHFDDRLFAPLKPMIESAITERKMEFLDWVEIRMQETPLPTFQKEVMPIYLNTDPTGQQF